MSVTDYRNAAHWYCKGKNYLLFDTQREVFINKGNEVTNFRGRTDIIESVTRGPDYNGTAKVATVGQLGEFYSTVFDLVALPAIDEGKVYQLDIYNPRSMIRSLSMGRIRSIKDGVVAFDTLDDDGDELGGFDLVDWRNIYIANEVGVHELIPVQ